MMNDLLKACPRSLPHLPDSTLTNFNISHKTQATSTVPATMKFSVLLLVACASSALGKCVGIALDTQVAVRPGSTWHLLDPRGGWGLA